VVLEKSTSYWDSKNVSLQKIIIYPTESNETAYNLYVAGKIDWTGQTSLPDKSLMALRKRQDYHEPLRLGINFLRLNIEKKPLNNLDVRKALHLAIDREALVTQVTKSGELAALSLTPDLLSNYQAPKAPGFNPAKAAYHLNKAGFCALGYQNPKCKPFPAMSILYNRDERHKAVLQAVIGMWKHYLGIQTISLRSREWKNYLQEQRQSQYEISRSGWIADYPDAVSFIELFMKGGSNNSTGWANTKYEELVQASRFEINPETRAKALQAAEEILLNDLPILPLYYFTTPFLLSPKVGGLYENILDVHPYKGIFIKGDTATAPEKGPEKTQ
jgi:oligopeptide transport system substrate-binding protein